MNLGRRLRQALAWLQALPQQGLMLGVRGYRLLLKPWIGNTCRFDPSCSAYALQALQQHGALRGSALSGWRLLRCHPWCDGGFDPVPHNPPRPAAGLFTRFVPPAERGAREPPTPTRKNP